jgi:hypothetical protein
MAEAPKSVELGNSYTEPAVKGDTSTSVEKSNCRDWC